MTLFDSNVFVDAPNKLTVSVLVIYFKPNSMYRVDGALGREAGARGSIEIGPQRYQTRPKHVPDVAWSELIKGQRRMTLVRQAACPWPTWRDPRGATEPFESTDESDMSHWQAEEHSYQQLINGVSLGWDLDYAAFCETCNK